MSLTVAPSTLDSVASASGHRMRLLVSAWLAGYKSKSTRAVYATGVGQWLDWCALNDIDPLRAIRAHLELWQRYLEESGPKVRKPRTIASRVGAVICWYRYLLREEVIDRDPTVAVRRPKIERKSPTAWLTRTQVADLLAAAQAIGGHPNALVCLLAYNGLRIAEACSLNIEDLTYDRLHPVITFTRKGGKSGRAVLTRPTEAALLEVMAGRTSGPLLLTAAGTRMNQKAAQRIIDRCMRNVRGAHGRITPHCLRHSWATAAVAAGVPIAQLQHDGGWADPRMATYYAHGHDQPDRATAHAVTAHFASAA